MPSGTKITPGRTLDLPATDDIRVEVEQNIHYRIQQV
jgi:hypothetical protein